MNSVCYYCHTTHFFWLFFHVKAKKLLRGIDDEYKKIQKDATKNSHPRIVRRSKKEMTLRTVHVVNKRIKKKTKMKKKAVLTETIEFYDIKYNSLTLVIVIFFWKLPSGSFRWINSSIYCAASVTRIEKLVHCNSIIKLFQGQDFFSLRSSS